MEIYTYLHHELHTQSCPLIQSLQMDVIVKTQQYCCKHVLEPFVYSCFPFSPPPRLLLLQQAN